MGDEIDVRVELARLQAMPMAALRAEFERVCGWRHSTNNRSTLVRRILWHRQHGPLSPEIVARAREIASQVLVREIPPPGWPGAPEAPVREPVRDARLPMPGAVLTREYRGTVVTVTVGEHDFEYEGERYSSLSAVATKITGSHVNGFRFFRIGPKEGK
jgi:hypothetical protein